MIDLTPILYHIAPPASVIKSQNNDLFYHKTTLLSIPSIKIQENTANTFFFHLRALPIKTKNVQCTHIGRFEKLCQSFSFFFLREASSQGR